MTEAQSGRSVPSVSPESTGTPGFLMLQRGLPWDGYKKENYGPLWDYRQLPRRAGPVGALVFHLIQDGTYSARGCPEWVFIPLECFVEYLGRGERTVRFVLDFLEEIHLIERHPDNPWSFKTHPENIAAAQILEPVRHPNASATKKRKRLARVSAPPSMAAFRSETGFNEDGFSDDGPSAETRFTAHASDAMSAGCNGRTSTEFVPSTEGAPADEFEHLKCVSQEPVKPVSVELKPISEEGKPVSSEREMGCAAREMDCSWNEVCRFFMKDLDDPKPLSSLSYEAGQPEVVAPKQNDGRPTHQDLDAIRQLLIDELSDRLPGDSPSDHLCCRIYEALRGAPLDWVVPTSQGTGLLRYRIRLRYLAIESYGLAESLAEDVGKSWLKHQAQVQQKKRDEHERTLARLTGQALDSIRCIDATWNELKQLGAVPMVLNALAVADHTLGGDSPI